jgi:hypothetical protein
VEGFPLSFNFVRAAEENNSENLHPIHAKELAQRYTVNGQDDAEHREIYGDRVLNTQIRVITKPLLTGGIMMNLIEEIKESLMMEIRPISQGLEYLEAVINNKDLELLNSLLKKHLGPAAKESGKKTDLPKEIQKLVDSLSGLRYEQSFFYKRDGNKVIYAAIWPWASNPDKITLKSGVSELVLTD